MAIWCYDARLTAQTGITQFRRPFPGGDWLQEKKMNDLPISMMRYVSEMNIIFNKDNLTPEETDKYRNYQTSLEKYYDNLRH
ncbi:MAG: hypothetical protein GY938_12740 [Ketobacter sp.]|nr:hypothetical protein [Ketobacter sp.]